MNRAIIIATCTKYRPWLYNFLSTYSGKYPLYIVHNTDDRNQYDARAVIEGIDQGFDEFLVLHDTLELKDEKFLDVIFEDLAGKSVALTYPNPMFMIKYRKEDLDSLPSEVIDNLKAVHDKWSAVLQEKYFCDKYLRNSKATVLFPKLDMAELNRYEYKLGRLNMILENDYLKKYKGSWDVKTANAAKDYIPTQEHREQ